jgi:hypothetical protein
MLHRDALILALFMLLLVAACAGIGYVLSKIGGF